MPANAIIQLEDVQVYRGNTRIVDSVSWQVNTNEHWVVLGPNGCGKTSLLRVLLGYLSPSRGRIHVLGAEYGRCDWRKLRAQLGIVSAALQPHIPDAEPALETVISGRYAQLDFWGHATRADHTAARAALTQLEAAHLAERPWGWLSQGERQRVLIARALVGQPRLLILDEPCAGLDPVARADFLALLERLAKRPVPTLVLVTHHVEEITPSFSHVLLLARGRVVAQGARQRVLTSGALTEAFGRPLRLRRHGTRLTLDVGESP